MDNKRIHVDDYINRLVINKKFRNNEYRKFTKNNHLIQNIEGNASPDILYTLIKKAKMSRKLQNMLVDILLYIDKNSITDRNFFLLSKFHKRKRNTYLSHIAHSELAFYQMITINRICGEFEAFAWLFENICCNDMFSEEDMLYILKENKAVTCYGIQTCIEFAHQKHGHSRKLDIAREWLKKKLEDGTVS